MAVVNITPTKMAFNTMADLPTMTALTSTTDGATVPLGMQDAKTVILLENVNASTAKTATINASDSIPDGNSLTVTIPAGGKKAIVVESGLFKNMFGSLKGKVHIIGESTDIKVGALILP